MLTQVDQRKLCMKNSISPSQVPEREAEVSHQAQNPVSGHWHKIKFVPRAVSKKAVMHTGFLVLLTTLYSPVGTTDSHLKVSTGVDFSSGDYGDEVDTDILYVPFTVKYDRFPWTLKLTVPYLQIKGPGTVIGAGDGIVVTGSENVERTTEQGLGDIIASLTYSLDLLSPQSPLFLDLTAKVKFPTADEDKGLGTGETDYYLQTDLAKVFGKTTLFGTLAYRFVGEPPDSDLDNTISASAGFSYKFLPKLSGGLIYDFRQAASNGVDNGHEVTAFANWKLAEQWTLMGYTGTGFTDLSPDYVLGLQIGYKIDLP